MKIERDSGIHTFYVMGIEVEVKWNAYKDHGNYNGPIDQCYPECSDIEIESISIDGESIDHFEQVFTQTWITELETEIWNIFGENNDE